MTGYYDIVLGVIPLSLAGLTALLLTAGMSISVAVPLASVVAIGVMGHAMFINAPVGTPSPTQHRPSSEPNQQSGVTAD